jgi:hypothetical protein
MIILMIVLSLGGSSHSGSHSHLGGGRCNIGRARALAVPVITVRLASNRLSRAGTSLLSSGKSNEAGDGKKLEGLHVGLG